MDVNTNSISAEAAADLLRLSETHFVDLKAVEISPSKLTKTLSAFANASGGEVFVGVGEFEGVDGVERVWNGFENEEAANAIFQVIEGIDPFGAVFAAEFFRAESRQGLVLHLTVFK